MRFPVLFLLLFITAALSASSYDEIVQAALSSSPDASAAELSHEAGLLSLLEAELDDDYVFGVSFAVLPFADSMNVADVTGLSFSMTAPDEDTSISAGLPFGVRYDGTGGSLSPYLSVEHVFDWGHNDELLKDLQADALRISAERAYEADLIAIRRSVLSLVSEILANESSRLEATMEYEDASKELSDSLSLGIVTQGSIGMMELELMMQRAEDQLRIADEEKTELLSRYRAYTGLDWDGIDDIPLPAFPDVASAYTSSSLEEAAIEQRIAEEEVLIAQSEYNPHRMTAGAEASGAISLGQGLYSDGSGSGQSVSLYGMLGWEGDDFTIAAEGGGIWDDDLRFTPSLTITGSWQSGNDESEDLTLRTLRNTARIRASEASDARREFAESRDAIANDILAWERSWAEMEADIRYREALCSMAELKHDRGMITDDELDDAYTELEILRLERDILLIEGLSLEAEAEELLV